MRVIRNTIFVVAVILFVALLYLISLQDIEIKELRIREQMTLSSQAFCSEEKSALFVLMIQDEGRRNVCRNIRRKKMAEEKKNAPEIKEDPEAKGGKPPEQEKPKKPEATFLVYELGAVEDVRSFRSDQGGLTVWAL